ncbi:MAG: glycosyltransferase [Lachnospiraceae bacterium]|nr:glycosyltransferase [Lachnospiraceae bacterium]
MRVLHIFTNPHLTNGATVFEYRVSSRLKKDNIYFDYLVTEEATEEEKARYAANGSVLYRLPIDNSHGLLIRELKVNREYYRFFKEHDYKIVYADTENALRAVHLLMARLAGVRVRVVHSHNTGLQTQSKASAALAGVIKGLFRCSATHYFACSDKAAEWLFPKKIYRNRQYKLLKNGVSLEEFRFNSQTRSRLRAELGLDEDAPVLGNVGRFMPQKNHSFMLSCFDRFHRKHSKAKLMLIGDGPLAEEIRADVRRRGLEDAVLFIGNVKNVSDYLQVMDLFFMPSLFEGLPITGIEAQANALPCLFADTITKELKLTELAHYLPLEEPEEKWTEKIEELLAAGRKDCTDAVRSSGYAIEHTVEELKAFYLKESSC